MKTNELMIGDMVRKLERGGHTVPVKIIAIYENNADYETQDGLNGCMMIGGYEPLPLTAEILEKNGFRKVERIPTKNSETGTWRSNKFCATIKRYFIDAQHCIFCLIAGHSKIGDISHVHELQHALRLCGIEKEIKL